MTLKDRLRELMAEQDPPLTADELARQAGVTGPAVLGWLKGIMPYPRTLNTLCAIFGVRRRWLLEGEGAKFLPKGKEGIAAEGPAEYSRREKITFIEEQRPELLPLLDAFLDTARKQLRAAPPRERARKARRSSK